MALVKVNVICPCGKLLITKNMTPTSTSSGHATCPACRNKVRWDISNGQAYTAYQR